MLQIQPIKKIYCTSFEPAYSLSSLTILIAIDIKTNGITYFTEPIIPPKIGFITLPIAPLLPNKITKDKIANIKHRTIAMSISTACALPFFLPLFAKVNILHIL